MQFLGLKITKLLFYPDNNTPFNHKMAKLTIRCADYTGAVRWQHVFFFFQIPPSLNMLMICFATRAINYWRRYAVGETRF